MFWVKKLKSCDDEYAWSVPYGDLVTLLLVVFVLLVSMSELKSGRRFDRISGAVRGAFGFPVAAASVPSERPHPTLLDRLGQAGVLGSSRVQLSGDTDEVLAPCDVLVGPDRMMIRIAGATGFDDFSAVLRPPAERAISRLGTLLADGKCRLEIRGHAGDGPIPPNVPFRDAMDLSYQRARAVAQVLEKAGVGSQRLVVGVCGDSDPLSPGSAEPTAAGANRRIELILHTVSSGREGSQH